MLPSKEAHPTARMFALVLLVLAAILVVAFLLQRAISPAVAQADTLVYGGGADQGKVGGTIYDNGYDQYSFNDPYALKTGSGGNFPDSSGDTITGPSSFCAQIGGTQACQDDYIIPGYTQGGGFETEPAKTNCVSGVTCNTRYTAWRNDALFNKHLFGCTLTVHWKYGGGYILNVSGSDINCWVNDFGDVSGYSFRGIVASNAWDFHWNGRDHGGHVTEKQAMFKQCLPIPTGQFCHRTSYLSLVQILHGNGNFRGTTVWKHQ